MPIHAVLAIFVLYSVPPEHRPIVGIQDVLPLPMVCYDFDGQQTDTTGNYDLVGSPTYYTDGHLGQAVLSSLSSLQASQGGELSPSQITIAFWFQGGGDINVARIGGANTPWGVSFSGGSLYWSISGADDEMFLENYLPADANWHHLVLWANGAELGIQLDGAAPITQAQNLPIPLDTTNNLVVAELPGVGDVHLDMLRVWDHALDANKRLADYNNGIGVSCEFLFTPTDVGLSSYSVILPSGGRGELIMGMTVGDLLVAAPLITLLAVVTFDLVRRLVRSGSL